MRISFGPGSAVLLGLGVVVGTGNGDKVLPYAHQAAGALLNLKALATPKDTAEGQSGSGDFFSSINARIEKAVAEVKDLVRFDARSAPPPIIIQQDDSSPLAVTAIKGLLVFGAVVGVCHILGINLWEVVGVTKKSIDSTLKGISQTINALHDGYEKGLEAVGNVLAKIRGDLKKVRDDTTAHLDEVQGDVADVRAKVSEVADSVDRMSELSQKANAGLQLLCQVLSENLPNSHLQRSLKDFAETHRRLEAPPAKPEGY